jgi:hypothetical protein
MKAIIGPELDHAVLLNLNVKYLLRDPSSKGSVDFSLVERSSGSTTKSIPNVIGLRTSVELVDAPGYVANRSLLPMLCRVRAGQHEAKD